VLRDAATGAYIDNSCVVFSPTSAPGMTNFTNVDGDGTWSFTTTEAGPFNLAFYATTNGDCTQPILSSPVPSWYDNQPLTGTDEHTIVPPLGALAVIAGSSNTVACLGATAMPTSACVIPDVVLSGTAYTTGHTPLANVCVFVLAPNGDGVQTLTNSAGHWSISGIPRNLNVVVIFVPAFGAPGTPCQGNGNGPPVPGQGQLQPVAYTNTWVNLGDPTFLADPHAWALARGATAITDPTSNIDACLTTASGTVTPRPTCTAAATTLAQTGFSAPWATSYATTLILTGALLLTITRRRRRPRHNA
jgi:hypothetical protein